MNSSGQGGNEQWLTTAISVAGYEVACWCCEVCAGKLKSTIQFPRCVVVVVVVWGGGGGQRLDVGVRCRARR